MKRKILVHPMLKTLIQTGIANLEGNLYEKLDACQSCGGGLSGYDIKRRYFATLSELTGDRSIFVRVKRFSCRNCGQVVSADSPFYPDTRMGAPVVDLCGTLSDGKNPSRAASVINALGIVIDRGTVRNYRNLGLPQVPSTEIFGLRLPVSILSLTMSTLQAGPVIRAEPFIAAGLPPAYRAVPGRAPIHKGHQRDEQKEKEKRPVK